MAKCIIYIDLNMVCAGVVKHPSEYKLSGFYEIQNPPKRYAVRDYKALMALFSIESGPRLQQEHKQWVEAELLADVAKRKAVWSESIAIGSEGFIEGLQRDLGLRVKGRSVLSENAGTVLKESPGPYITLFEGKKSALRLDNSYFLNHNNDKSDRYFGPTPKSTRTFDTRGEAIVWAAAVEREMLDRRYQNPRLAMSTSFEQAVDRYLTTISSNKA